MPTKRATRRTRPNGIVVDPGGSWGARLAKGERVRFTDIEGQQAVDFLCYNAADVRDRYNAANTMKMGNSIYINTGTILYGEYATPLMKVVASTCNDHDTIGGCCSVEMDLLRYGVRTPACRANFIPSTIESGRLMCGLALIKEDSSSIF